MTAHPAESVRPVAIISGGSSGIGLACARVLVQQDYHVVLLARDARRLEAAAAALAGAGAGTVEALVLDVDDSAACSAAIDDIVARHGRIDWLITSAGFVEPGLIDALDLASHRRQMQTNYFGTLHLVLPTLAHMRRRRAGRVTLISSAAAFVGIVGYGGYAPGKFAVRALGEVLRVECAPFGVSVGVAFPPDTDTPQLAQENLTKPEATRRITAGGGVWPPDLVAARILAQAAAGDFMLTPSRLMTAFGWCHSLYAPVFRWKQGRVLRRLGRAAGRRAGDELD